VAGGPAGGGIGLEEEHEEHVNHEAWAIPYADMVTLLMALFLMLFAISSIDLAKFEALAANVGAELGSGSGSGSGGGGDDGVLEGGDGILEGSQAVVPTRAELAEEALVREERREAERSAEAVELSEVEAEIARQAQAAGLGGSVRFRTEARGLVVTVVADEVLFDPGSADLRTGGREVLAQVATAVRGLPNDLAIEGHTDDRPIATSRYPSNWELSTARATSVLRFMVDELGLPAKRVTAAGYGAERPLEPNGSDAGRAANRRVEVAVLTEVGGA
jgi:chemotaxis protein MotB